MTDPTHQPGESVHIIACGVLAHDLRHVAERLPVETTMEFLPGGLHARPDELRRRLQQRIDQASARFRGRRIVVGYGVCGLGTVGIHARNVALAVPRVNDCIALFLGSDAAYREQFGRYPGTYYVSAGWVDEKTGPQSLDDAPIHCGPECFTFGQLVERYGEENAEAGTSEARVEVRVHDRVGLLADGGHLFLGRHLTAQLSGRPDLARLAARLHPH